MPHRVLSSAVSMHGTRVGLRYFLTSFDKNWLVFVECGLCIFELPF